MNVNDLRSVARESRNLMDGGWYTVPFLRTFIDEDDATVFEEADAAYIAAARPDVILGLLDRIAELEKTAGALDDLIVSYADLTHRIVVEGGDWRDIASEWGTVVAAARERRFAALELAARSSSNVET